MADLFATGRIIDLILVLVAVEAVVLLGWGRMSGRGPAPAALAALAAHLASGASLMLAVRAALTGAGWVWVAACMLAALTAHLVDLYLTVRRRTASA